MTTLLNKYQVFILKIVKECRLPENWVDDDEFYPSYRGIRIDNPLRGLIRMPCCGCTSCGGHETMVSGLEGFLFKVKHLFDTDVVKPYAATKIQTQCRIMISKRILNNMKYEYYKPGGRLNHTVAAARWMWRNSMGLHYK